MIDHGELAMSQKGVFTEGASCPQQLLPVCSKAEEISPGGCFRARSYNLKHAEKVSAKHLLS